MASKLRRCHSCNKIVRGPRSSCSLCIRKINLRRHERVNALKAQGLCTENCGATSATGKVRCALCLDKRRMENRKEYRRRTLCNQCVYCQRAATAGIFCMTHWLKNIGCTCGLGNKKGIKVLQRIWSAQKGYCALTGDTLVPGKTASLDHIIPRSKGGTNEESNLRWVLLSVNTFKLDMADEEFVQICQKVVSAHEQRSNIVQIAQASLERMN